MGFFISYMSNSACRKHEGHQYHRVTFTATCDTPFLMTWMANKVTRVPWTARQPSETVLDVVFVLLSDGYVGTLAMVIMHVWARCELNRCGCHNKYSVCRMWCKCQGCVNLPVSMTFRMIAPMKRTVTWPLAWTKRIHLTTEYWSWQFTSICWQHAVNLFYPVSSTKQLHTSTLVNCTYLSIVQICLKVD